MQEDIQNFSFSRFGGGKGGAAEGYKNDEKGGSDVGKGTNEYSKRRENEMPSDEKQMYVDIIAALEARNAELDSEVKSKQDENIVLKQQVADLRLENTNLRAALGEDDEPLLGLVGEDAAKTDNKIDKEEHAKLTDMIKNKPQIYDAEEEKAIRVRVDKSGMSLKSTVQRRRE
ncbi:hypothetical protein TrCOL_g11695 [Triparma columacea]|uniref:Uncharacterized protein n=1 Tax=Triparma columacea TaxID=722753 RepID=A0A9W7L6W1_9STRA|nr:hypothetical protein TrCOL_g11695 [Triparma columacea]